jgi:hypothetical protein
MQRSVQVFAPSAKWRTPVPTLLFFPICAAVPLAPCQFALRDEILTVESDGIVADQSDGIVANTGSDHKIKSYVGLEFHTPDETYNFYNNYACRVALSVHKRSRTYSTKNVSSIGFVCNKVFKVSKEEGNAN